MVDISAVETFTIGFRTGIGGYRLVLSPRAQEVSLGSSARTSKRAVPLDPKALVRIEAFVVDSLIEVFVNERWAFTTRAYDHLGGRLKLSSEGGSAIVQKMQLQIPREKI